MHIKGSFICSEGIKVKLDGDEEEIGLLKSLVKVIFFRESKLGQKCDICSILLIFRPISVSFLICTLGKETDMATTLRLEKFGEIIFLQ